MDEPVSPRLTIQDLLNGPAEPVRRMKFANLFDIAKQQVEPDWLIRDFMECKTHAMLFGEPESGKSLVMFDMLLCIATGRKWRGREVKQGAVFYLCGEGQAGLGRRVKAWQIHNNAEDERAHFHTSDLPAALTDPESAEMVRDVIKEMSAELGVIPTAVGIDTLARNFGAGDENSAKDIGNFIANLDNYLINDLGATVVTSHHTGHGDKERARGSMSLPGAVDVSYRVSKADKIIMMECKKSKDFAKPHPVSFDLVVKTTGIDSRGHEITGATVNSCPTEKFRSGRPILEGKKLDVFDVLVNAYQRTERHLKSQGRYNEDPVIDIQFWRTEAAKLYDKHRQGPGSEGWNTARRNANRVINSLMEDKHVQLRPNGKDVYPTYLG